MALLQSLSQGIATIGNSLGLPEFGISERVSAPTQGWSTLPSGFVSPVASNSYAPSSQKNPTQNYTPTQNHSPGSVLGANINAPSSGNGGSNQSQANNPYDIQPTAPNPNEVGATFDPVFDTLNQAESNLRGQMPGLISEAEAQAQANQQLLNTNKESSVNQLNQQAQSTKAQQDRLMGDQRRIYQELGTANQQRFGGASSAGQAASEIQGREFQKSRFGIQENAQQALQTIQTKMQEVEQNYQNSLQQLQVNLQTAKNDIQRRFQDRMLEITNQRNATESAKQQARVSAMYELRNQAQQINIAKAQFESDLRNQAQANSAQLQSAAQQFLSAQNQGQQAANGYAGYQASSIPGVQSSQGGTTNPILTGYKNEDLIGSMGSIPGSSATDPRFQNYQPFGR